jgi:cyanophycinase
VIDGAKVGVRQGLGLVPNVMFDQHFIKRQRASRLFGYVLQYPALLGVGVDEDTALLVIDNRFGEIVGASQIMFVDAAGRRGAMLIHILRAGERFDLKKRKKR